jgi:cytochrome P450
MNLAELDPLAAVTAPDPYPYYAQLVAETPFYRDDRLDSWVATSAAAVETVLTSPWVGVRPPGEPVPPQLAESAVGKTFGKLVRQIDGRAHASLKLAVGSAFDLTDLRKLAATSDRCAGLLMCTLDTDRPASLLSFIFGLPALVTASSLGFETDDALRSVVLTRNLMGALHPEATPKAVAIGAAAVDSLRTLLREPGRPGTLLDALESRAEYAGVALDDLISNVIGLFIQGHDATAGLIGNALIAAAKLSETARAALRAYPGNIAPFVREVARFDAPIQNTRRYAIGNHAFFGSPVRTGESILVVLAAANRDSSVNLDPDRFDPTRVDARTYTFGFGAHACPGLNFATTVAAAGLSRLLDTGFDWAALRETDYLPRTNARIPSFAPAAPRAS